jgi:predicted nucleic acid-binding protein
MILDSTFLIDLMNSDEGAIALATEIESGNEPQRIPAQVVYELYVGVGYTDQAFVEVGKIRNVIVDRPVVETTEQIAKIAGRMDGQLRREGQRVAANDVIIGATAKRFDEPVVTNNVGDFERLDVSVKTY